MHDIPSLAPFLARRFADLPTHGTDSETEPYKVLTAEDLLAAVLQAESAVVRDLATAEGDGQLALCELACTMAIHQGIECTSLQEYCEELAHASGGVAFKCTDLAGDVTCGDACDFDLAKHRAAFLAENALPSGESLMVYDTDNEQEFSAILYVSQLAPSVSPTEADNTLCCVTGCTTRFEGPNYTRNPQGYRYIPKARRYSKEYRVEGLCCLHESRLRQTKIKAEADKRTALWTAEELAADGARACTVRESGSARSILQLNFTDPHVARKGLRLVRIRSRQRPLGIPQSHKLFQQTRPEERVHLRRTPDPCQNSEESQPL